jgi:serine/threonine-protein kinase
VHPAAAIRCACGGTLAEAAVPHVLRGVFRFEQRVGSGGMGVVYRATDLTLKREVAIKTLPRLTPAHAAQLTREAQAMAALNHTNLAVIYGIESWRSTPFLVEEYLPGGTLVDRLRDGPLPIAEALELGATLADVLGRLHDSCIIHCDIKASNIGFSQSGVVKLLDFGIAHLLRDADEVLTTTVAEPLDDPVEVSSVPPKRGITGTPAYMSPEAARGAAPAPGFDVWSLSVVLFEAIAARRPFDGRTAAEVFLQVATGEKPDLTSLRSDCPPEVAQFFDRALAADASRRPADADDLRTQLLGLRGLAG